MEPSTVVSDQIKADFDRLEAELAAANPGVMDLLRLTGEYEAALHQVQQYLGILDPGPPTFFATDNSTSPPR